MTLPEAGEERQLNIRVLEMESQQVMQKMGCNTLYA
jgi:hypothetical protein